MRHKCLGTSTLPMRSVGGVLTTQNATMDSNLNAKKNKKNRSTFELLTTKVVSATI